MKAVRMDGGDEWMMTGEQISCDIHQGAKICLFQCSYESPAIFTLLQLTFSSSPSLTDLKTASGGEPNMKKMIEPPSSQTRYQNRLVDSTR